MKGLFVSLLFTFFAVAFGRSPPPYGNGLSCPCPKILDPVCGVNGKTYANECLLDCAGVLLRHRGKCGTCPCPKILRPVCGTDGVTYGNICLMECRGVKLLHPGSCLKCDSVLMCLVPPCQYATCPMIEDAICSPGCSCNARFFKNGREVTKECNAYQ